MSRLSACRALLVTLLLLVPAGSLAAGGGGQAVVFVADSRRYAGWQAFLPDLYNESLWLFTLLTVVAVPVFSLILSSAMGFLLSKTGIDLKSRGVSGH